MVSPVVLVERSGGGRHLVLPHGVSGGRVPSWIAACITLLEGMTSVKSSSNENYFFAFWMYRVQSTILGYRVQFQVFSSPRLGVAALKSLWRKIWKLFICKFHCC